MIATQELIAAALALAALAERNTDDRDEWQHAIDSVREACARAMVQPDIAEVRPGMEGWKEAAIAWEVCASIHREYAKKKDPFFTTLQSDFVKHAEATRAKALTPEPDMAERDDLIADNERLMQIAAQEVSAAEVPMPQGYAERPSDYTGGIWIESQMRTYGDAREAAGYARGVAEERERCAAICDRMGNPLNVKYEGGGCRKAAAAIRNAQYQAISTTAHIALGTIRGPEEPDSAALRGEVKP